jgi:hypothetical protein
LALRSGDGAARDESPLDAGGSSFPFRECDASTDETVRWRGGEAVIGQGRRSHESASERGE